MKETEKTVLPPEPPVTEALGVKFGLKPEEYAHIVRILGREPSYTELGIFSVMWSEHCSYKSSRLHLKKLPTSAPWVIQGPGENAGVIDIGDGQAAVFKMESHNHPSYIEPYQGAATGVGGIMRDIFTMGARPIANLNALRFGDPSHPKTRGLVSGVVAGISGYGNCMGVPTVGGETQFHKSYNGNILVNAMTVGVVDQDKIYYSRGAAPDMPVVYVGSKTGRDGIHGATMASAEFEEGKEGERPTVQVGDPFVEKLLLEACLELMATDSIICIQDMGAAGLTSSSVEIADKGSVGVHLDLDKVPMREPGMVPYELMLSESQERMLMILKPECEDAARKIFEKWDLDFAVIGKTMRERRLVLSMYGKTWCDIPVPPLVDEAPVYDRPQGDYPKALPLSLPEALLAGGGAKGGLASALEKLLSCPDMASKRWIWEQYDSLVRGDSVFTPGIPDTQNGKAADAALVRVPSCDREGKKVKALAFSSDCNPHYCFADPVQGGRQAVAESYRNLCAVGARPLAVTNNLNFGNPEKPVIMAQFVQCLEGMSEACRALDYPIVSGNVSLYNETSGEAILPTPVIGGVGIMEDSARAVDMAFKGATSGEGETVFLIGGEGTHLGQSLFLRVLHGVEGREAGPPPSVDLKKERLHGEFVRSLVDRGQITACHDIAEGGLLCALAEMAMAGGVGAEISANPSAQSSASPGLSGSSGSPNASSNEVAFWFGEDQARYVVTTKNPQALESAAKEAKIPVLALGRTGGRDLAFSSGESLSVQTLIEWNRAWLFNYMNNGGQGTQGK